MLLKVKGPIGLISPFETAEGGRDFEKVFNMGLSKFLEILVSK